jgi:hypothetical protein
MSMKGRTPGLERKSRDDRRMDPHKEARLAVFKPYTVAFPTIGRGVSRRQSIMDREARVSPGIDSAIRNKRDGFRESEAQAPGALRKLDDSAGIAESR